LRTHDSSAIRPFAAGFRTRFCAASALAVIAASATLAFAGRGQGADDAPAGAYTGMITDSICGARHVRKPNLDAANCTRECVRTGAKYKLIDGEKSYFLEGDFAELAQFAGQRAKVSGSLEGETIRVSAVNPI
jgi:hypothetical protein